MSNTNIDNSSSPDLNLSFRDSIESLFDDHSQLFPGWEIVEKSAFFEKQVDTLRLSMCNNARGAYAVIRAAHKTVPKSERRFIVANDFALTIGWDKDPEDDNRVLTLQSYGGGINIHDDRIVPSTLTKNPKLVHRLTASTGWRNQLTNVRIDNLWQYRDGSGSIYSDASFYLDSVEVPGTSNTEVNTYIQIKPECNRLAQRVNSKQVLNHYDDVTVEYPMFPSPEDKTNPYITISLNAYQHRILRGDKKIHSVKFTPLPNVLSAEIINRLVQEQIALAIR